MTPTYKVSDIALYKFRQDPPLRPVQHVTGIFKWAPEWSLPCRIVAFNSRESVTLKQLWTPEQELIIRPIAEIRLLSRRIPLCLRDIASKLLRPRRSGRSPSRPASPRERPGTFMESKAPESDEH